jgi:hypothetical protein
MQAYHAGAASVAIPPGDYRFGAETWGPHGVLFPLEFDDIQRDAAHPFTIDATGATFWFALPNDENPAEHFALGFRNCSNVVLKGLALDRATRGNTEGRITRIDYPGNRIEIQLSRGSWTPSTFTGATEQRILPFKANGTFCAPLYALQSGGVHLRYTSITPSSSPGRYWVNMKDTALLTLNRDPNWVRAYGSQGTLSVGDGLCCVYTVTGAISLIGCRSMVIDGLKDYIAKGVASETGGYGDHLWKDCYFGPRPGTNQWQGGDGFMCNALEHGSTFDNVTIIHSTDDTINIHGYWGYVQSTAGNTVAFGPNQAGADSLGADATAGDTIVFYDRKTAEPRGTARAVAVTGATVTLDRPAGDFADCVAEWPGHECAGWLIENCNWHDDYQRVLIQTGPGTIRHCVFTRLGSHLQLESVFQTNNEGGIPHDICITDNTFTDVEPMPHGVNIGMYLLTYGRPTVDPIKNLTIERNLFNNPSSAAILLRNSSDDTIIGNTINNPLAYTVRAVGDSDSARQPVQLDHCRGVVFSNNAVHDPGNYTRPDPTSGSSLLAIGAECSGIVLRLEKE